jgi:hypothetical protein
MLIARHYTVCWSMSNAWRLLEDLEPLSCVGDKLRMPPVFFESSCSAVTLLAVPYPALWLPVIVCERKDSSLTPKRWNTYTYVVDVKTTDVCLL